MLGQQCDFIKVPVFDYRPPKIAELRKMGMPDDFLDFYGETDGGIGRVFFPEYSKPCTFVLYGNEKMQEMKNWFMQFSAMLYEELYLLDERKLNEEEQERLRSVSADLVILGECGDPKWPDYMFFYKGTFFLKERDSLDFPFQDYWIADEEKCASRHSYYDFFTTILSFTTVNMFFEGIQISFPQIAVPSLRVHTAIPITLALQVVLITSIHRIKPLTNTISCDILYAVIVISTYPKRTVTRRARALV